MSSLESKLMDDDTKEDKEDEEVLNGTKPICYLFSTTQHPSGYRFQRRMVV